MLADTLTKLATAPVILVLHDAKDGIQPNHKTSVSPGRQNRRDEAGDGPPGRQPQHTTSVSAGRQNRRDEAGDGLPGGISPGVLAVLREIPSQCDSSRESRTKNVYDKGNHYMPWYYTT